jgi:hypothetical protein
MRKLTIALIALIAIQLGSCRRDPCEALKTKRLEVNFENMTGAEAQIGQLQACGFDSVDCILAMYVVGQICTERQLGSGGLSLSNTRFSIPFPEIVEKLNQFKRTPLYAEERRLLLAHYAETPERG